MSGSRSNVFLQIPVQVHCKNLGCDYPTVVAVYQLTDTELAYVLYTQVKGEAKRLLEVLEIEDLQAPESLKTIWSLLDAAHAKISRARRAGLVLQNNNIQKSCRNKPAFFLQLLLPRGLAGGPPQVVGQRLTRASTKTANASKHADLQTPDPLKGALR